MKVGFTGTRKGMTRVQLERVGTLLAELKASRGYHGAAHGSDRQFHELMAPYPRELFPSSESQHRWAISACSGGKDIIHPIDFDEIRRNHRFVDKTEVVLATPAGFIEQSRGSGTWATMRYCLKIDRRLFTIWADGSVTEGAWR